MQKPEQPPPTDLDTACGALERRSEELREEAAELDYHLPDDPDSPYQSAMDRAAELRSRAESCDRVARWIDKLRDHALLPGARARARAACAELLTPRTCACPAAVRPEHLLGCPVAGGGAER
jgi:hypothetical protein